MKILNWKKFNESLKPLKSLTFKIPIAVCSSPSSSMFSGNINQIMDKLDDGGFDGSQFQSEYDEWFERNCPVEPGDEPDRDDYDDEDDYNYDYERWEEKDEEYGRFNNGDSIYNFIDIHYGSMFDLKRAFTIFDIIDNVCSEEQKLKIFESVTKFLETNKAGLIALEEELIDEPDIWNETDESSYECEIVGDNFENGYLVIKIESENINFKRLTEKIYFTINFWYDYIIDLRIDDIDIHIYWSDESVKDYGIEKYKVIFPEIESYDYQKGFLEETPEDYKLLEPFGVNQKIKEEFDYLWSGENMELM